MVGSWEDGSRLTHVILNQVGCSASQGQALPPGEEAGKLLATTALAALAVDLGAEKAQRQLGVFGSGGLCYPFWHRRFASRIHHPTAAHASVPTASHRSRITEFAGKIHSSSCQVGQLWQALTHSRV